MKPSPLSASPVVGTLCGPPRGWSAHVLAAPSWALAWGLGLTLAQILVACLLSGQGNLRDAYMRLFGWDGGWYATIVEAGYFRLPNPDPHSNIGFFPGFPLFARLVKITLGIHGIPATVVASQFACWGFWTYLILLGQRWRLPRSLAALAVGIVLVHPASFFLVASYSESLFVMNLLGFLYWTQSSHPAAKPMSALHGFVMTATRIVGLPLVVVPLLDAWLSRRQQAAGVAPAMSRLAVALAVGVAASLGCLLFFGYCQWRFGQWDLYQKTQAAGWGLETDYLGLFSPSILRVGWPRWSEGFIDPKYLSRLSVPVTLFVLGILVAAECRLARLRPDSGWRSRAAFLGCAGLLFYVSASAYSTRAMSSMIRYTLCVQVLLALAIVHLLSRVGPVRPLWRRLGWAVATVWGVVSVSFQLALTYRFTHGLWVA